MSSPYPSRLDREDFDDLDESILMARVAARSAIKGPRVGDFCILLNGDVRRFTYHHGRSLQTTVAGDAGSFYLAANGLLDYSGSLDKPIAVSALTLLPAQREGRVWWFSHNLPRAHNGVTALIPCRVYQEGQQ